MKQRITKTKHICIIGTETTISSKIYSKKICEFNNTMNIMEIACPLLVPIIEEGLENTDIAFEIVKLYLNPILNTKIDTLILGCTHYPIISRQLDNLLLDTMHYISSGLPLAQHLNDYLISNKMINLNNKISTEFYVSDSPKKFQMLGSKFLANKNFFLFFSSFLKSFIISLNLGSEFGYVTIAFKLLILIAFIRELI